MFRSLGKIYKYFRNGPVRIYGPPEYNTEVMLLGDGEYDMESGEVEQLFWLQVYLDYAIIVYRNASCVLYAQI